jgi:glycosyltransferase involved in cell wall biosynthesis
MFLNSGPFTDIGPRKEDKLKTKRSNLVLIYRSVETEHLGKDVFLVPYYLGKILNMNVRIVYSRTKTNRNIPSIVRGVKLVPLRNIFSNSNNEILRNLANLLYILFHAPWIDLLMQFYFSIPSAAMGVLYKNINKKGMLYIKSDGRMGEWPLLGYYNSIFLNKRQKILTKIKKRLFKSFLEYTDLITIETNIGYTKFITQKFLNIDLKNKVRLLFNGFDKEQFDQYGIKQKDYPEKENIIITVGRLGAYPKNTEMLLKAAERLEFKNWKIVFIGPIEKTENDFQKTIDGFYLSNPNLTDRVFFTGPIYNKEELWEWYNKAKIFVLTSIYESFGIVLTEALFFKNYIISTDVGSASDLIKMGYGKIIPQNDPVFLSGVLQKIITEDNLKIFYDQVGWDANDVSWKALIKDAVLEILSQPFIPEIG